MDAYTHLKVFSTERIQKYLNHHANDEAKALAHYKANILLSESTYSALSTIEVALRNSLNRELTVHFGTVDWYLQFATTPGLSDINREITLAKRHITKRDETITGSKVVAELTLGFWVRLLNAEYEKVLWKSLRRAFPFMPKKDRKRHNVSVPLNKIRNFRNRVYHNEPIAWRLEKPEEVYNDILTVLGWLNTELPAYAIDNSRFPEVLTQIRSDLGIA